MPRYRITLSDGRIVTLEAPTTPTEADVLDALGESADVNVAAGMGASGTAKVAPDSLVDQTLAASERFAGRVASNLNPMPIAESMVRESQRTPTGVLDAAGKGMLGPLYGPVRDDYAVRQERLAAAEKAYQSGNHVEALNHLLGWLVPFAGPMAASFGDKLQEGDLASATADIATVGLLPKAIGGAAEGVRGVAGSVAKGADRVSTQRMVDAIAPSVGANKVRLGNVAAKVAPELARDPALGAFSRAGIADAIEGRLVNAGAEIDAVASQIPKTRMEPTTPIVRGLESKIAELTRRGIKGDVVSANHASRVNVLKQALDEVRAIGSLANFDNLNKLRQDWDLGGKPKYSPATTADYLAKQGEAGGWADAAGVLREYMAQREPKMAVANADYSLYRQAADVVRAAEETERVRPRVGRRMFMGAVGGTVGGAAAGPMAAAAGLVIGPVLDAVLVSGPTTKIATSRMLASLSDALKLKRYQQAGGIMTRMAKTAGVYTPEVSRAVQEAVAFAEAASARTTTTTADSLESKR